MDVSVIIVSYNTYKLTIDCLKSVFEKTNGLDYEVIVIDNASTDRSVEMIQQMYPQVHLIAERTNHGFGKANNIAASIAKGKYIFLLNSDTLLVNNAIKILFDYIKSDSNIGIVGGQMLDRNLNKANSCDAYTSWIDEICIALLPANYIKSITIEVSYNHDINGFVYGADMMIDKQYFNQLNGFDQDFFMYDEDKELSFRFKKMGYKTSLVTDALIIHFGGQSGNINNTSYNNFIDKWSFSESRYSRFVYLHKVYGHEFAFLIYLICLLKAKVATFVFTVLRNRRKQTFWKKYSLIYKQQYNRYLQKFKS